MLSDQVLRLLDPDRGGVALTQLLGFDYAAAAEVCGCQSAPSGRGSPGPTTSWCRSWGSPAADDHAGDAPLRPAPESPVLDRLDDLRAALAGRASPCCRPRPARARRPSCRCALLDEPWLGDGRIVVLEPRRLATRAAARRMAALLGEEVGGTVGYRTRDERRVGPDTRIEVVTEGILTRRLQHDPSLPGVGLVVFDEVHERNLQADLALALALDARRRCAPTCGCWPCRPRSTATGSPRCSAATATPRRS